VLTALVLSACDLRQKIVDMPGNVGDFIASRHPALLADPDTEIYEYASVLDYGNPNGAELYGEPPRTDDYPLSYAEISDYIFPGQPVQTEQVQELSVIERDYGKLVVAEKKAFVLNSSEVVVKKGDTAYSLAKKYNMPVERLAVINNLDDSYSLRVGQKLKVENAEIITTQTEIEKPVVSVKEPAKEQSPVAAPKVAEKPVKKAPDMGNRSSSKFAWPIKGKIVSDFGTKSDGSSNDGINIAGLLGAAVSASDNGLVAYAGNEIKGMGNLIIIQHSGGWMTVYAHLDKFDVKRGDKVSVGQKIGNVGMTGRVDTPQLHFEVRKGAKKYDPKTQLK